MAVSSRVANMDKAMSVEEIVALASEPFFSQDFSMPNWFRTADLMLKQVSL